MKNCDSLRWKPGEEKNLCKHHKRGKTHKSGRMAEAHAYEGWKPVHVGYKYDNRQAVPQKKRISGSIVSNVATMHESNHLLFTMTRIDGRRTQTQAHLAACIFGEYVWKPTVHGCLYIHLGLDITEDDIRTQYDAHVNQLTCTHLHRERNASRQTDTDRQPAR